MSERREVLSVEQRSAGRALVPGWIEAPPVILDRVAGRLPSASDALDAVEGRTGATRARPLSPAQEVQWSLDHASEGSSTHIIPRAYRLRGSLDGDALARALDVLVQRHEALRTTFAPFDGSLAQLVAARGMTLFQRADLSRRPADEREAAMRRLLRREARRGFDLQRGPMLRSLLVRIDADEHVLLLATPAIAADEWSMRLLWRELGAAYSAEAAGQPVTLSPPAHRLTSFADREFEPVLPVERVRLASYWGRVLHEASGHVDLPRKAAGGRVGSRESVVGEFDADLVRRLRHVARERRVSMFMLLTAAYAALLSRYTGQASTLIAAPIVHRRRPELEWMVGCFTALLPLRVDVGETRDFGDLLEGVRGVALDAYEHAGLPEFPARGRTPALSAESAISLDDARDEPLAFGHLAASRVAVEYSNASFAISLRFEAKGHGLVATVDYRADLFAQSTIRRMLDHFSRILHSVASDPNRSSSTFGLVDATERRLLLSMGRGPVVVRDSAATVWSMFEEQVRRTPCAIAVECDGDQATYASTLKSALQVASALREQGIGEGSRVGLLLDPCTNVVPATLGVMAAGAACVPIPRSRDVGLLPWLASDSGMSGLIVDRPGRPEASALRDGGVAVMAMSEMRDSRTTPVALAGPSAFDAAWVTYVAGKDVRPRGIVMGHEALASRFRWQSHTFAVGVGDGVLQLADEGQPSATVPLFPIIAGGCIVIVPDGVSPARTLRRDLAAYVSLSPASLERMLASGAKELWAARALRGVISAGEAPEAGLEGAFRRLSIGAGRGDIRLHMVYAHAETSGAATHRVVPPLDRGGAGVSLGRPIANVRVYVVDERGALCPLGARGEIWIGGRPVARGYHNRRDLTAQRFFRDPFASGGFVVRTGDVGRWRPDGQLEYLGPARA